jgi:hypothetical protein
MKPKMAALTCHSLQTDLKNKLKRRLEAGIKPTLGMPI